MWNNAGLLFSYLNGLFAGLGGCTLPVLSVMVARLSDRRFSKVRFILEFFIVQFLLFSFLNVSLTSFYSVFRWLQPYVLLLASILTFVMGVYLYWGRALPLPSMGGIYGLAFSPCSVGFVVATVTSSRDVAGAILSALFFALGIVTPLFITLVLLKSVEPLVKHYRAIEKIGSVLLIVVSYYLAYLSGSSWG